MVSKTTLPSIRSRFLPRTHHHANHDASAADKIDSGNTSDSQSKGVSEKGASEQANLSELGQAPLPITLEPWPPRPWWRRMPFMSTEPRPILSALDETDPRAATSPEETGSIFSHIWFSWVDPLIRVGYTRPIEKDDLWLLPDDRRSSVLGARLLQALEKRQAERKEYIKKHPKKAEKDPLIPPLMWAMNDVVFRYLWFGGILKLLADIGT